MTIYVAALFLIFSPNVFFTIPLKSKLATLALHAILFALVYSLTHKDVYAFFYGSSSTTAPKMIRKEVITTPVQTEQKSLEAFLARRRRN
jgi:hypothetical protein